jgi:hypothetical protein
MESEPIEKGIIPIKVSSEIVGHLSSRLYSDFARAVKELISNSYDAGAMEVKIRLDIKKRTLIVRDDGKGMSKEDIENKLFTIAGTTPATYDRDSLGRLRVGKFGIGFLSIFPYCESIQIITKKVNEDKMVVVKLNSSDFFKEKFIATSYKIPYEIFQSDMPRGTGETIISLINIKDQILDQLKKPAIGSVSVEKLGGYERFKWTLCQFAPISYPKWATELREYFADPLVIPMRLWLDGEELFRNVQREAKIIERGESTINDIKVRYAIMTSFDPVKPEEARGLQIRLRNVGVGLPTDFSASKLTGTVPGKLNYLTGEVYIVEGLEDSLIIDRDNFSYTEEVAKFYKFFGEKLISWNRELEDRAKRDKLLYKELDHVKGGDKIVKQLLGNGAIEFKKERLRLGRPKSRNIRSRKKPRDISLPAEKISQALKEKGYNVEIISGTTPSGSLPISIDNKMKKALVFKDSPDLTEEIQVLNKKFNISYDTWEYSRTPYSICKLDPTNHKVTFNKGNPIFSSDFPEDKIKKLSLGFLILSDSGKTGRELLEMLNKLISETLLND